jgi:lipopolysaccharide transport system permease protein
LQHALAHNHTSHTKLNLLAYLGKVYHYRKMVRTLVRRDLKKQYAQTFLGVLWSAIQPAIGLVVFTLFFVYIFKIDTAGIAYPLVALTGIVPWFYFLNVVSSAGNSLADNQDLIKRLYFPRLIFPLAKSITAFVDLGIAVLLYTLLAVFYGQLPGKAILLLPVFLGMLVLLALTLGIWLAALTIRFRDLQNVVPYLLNLGIWVTPVFYPVSVVPQPIQPYLHWNPMAGIIEGFRYSLLGTGTWDMAYLYPWPFVLIAFVGGLLYFRRTETIVSDYL